MFWKWFILFLKCIVKLFSKVSHPKHHFLCHTLWLSNFLIHCLKSDSPDSFCQTGFSFLQLRRERSFFQRTKLVSFCLCPLLNDEAIDYKLYRDYPDIYFFPGRSFEEQQFTYHDEVHEINALIEEVSQPLIFLPRCTNGLRLRHGLSFFRWRRQLNTKLVNFCLSPLLNDKAIDDKLYRDYPDIYFFSWQVFGRSRLHI